MSGVFIKTLKYMFTNQKKKTQTNVLTDEVTSVSRENCADN